MSNMPNRPAGASCACFAPEYAGACLCSPDERVLRIWSTKGAMSLMTPEQRAWCLSEIGSVEGHSDHLDEWRAANDSALARGVLDAWRDYARDKGLY